MAKSHSSSATATSLLLGLQSQDEHAWTQLVDLYSPLIFHWCHRFNLANAEASDILQEVFVSVARVIGNYRINGGKFRAWLWTITRNKIRDYVRRENRQALAEGGTSAQIAIAALPDQSADEPTSELEASRLVTRALNLIENDFQKNTWEAFYLSTIEGVDTETVAKRLNLSKNGVRQAKSRVLRRLRETLGDL